MKTRIDIVDLLVEWGNTQPGLQSRIYEDEDARFAQFYTNWGYGLKRPGVWLACAIYDEEGLRIWGPDSFGETGGTPRGPEGGHISGKGIYWLKPYDPEFFSKLHKVLFRFL